MLKEYDESIKESMSAIHVYEKYEGPDHLYIAVNWENIGVSYTHLKLY